MANDRRAVIEELYRRLNARDTDVVDLCNPDIEWRWPGNTPEAAPFTGHEGLAHGLDQWSESWDELVMEPDEIIEDGDYARAAS